MRAYYNENDPFAAEWSRELIREGEITEGRVDGRSIVEVEGIDVAGYERVHLFAGIESVLSLRRHVHPAPDETSQGADVLEGLPLRPIVGHQ